MLPALLDAPRCLAPQVRTVLALLVHTYKDWRLRSSGRERVRERERESSGRARQLTRSSLLLATSLRCQCTCFTSTNVQIVAQTHAASLPSAPAHTRRTAGGENACVLSLLALLVQNVEIVTEAEGVSLSAALLLTRCSLLAARRLRSLSPGASLSYPPPSSSSATPRSSLSSRSRPHRVVAQCLIDL